MLILNPPLAVEPADLVKEPVPLDRAGFQKAGAKKAGGRRAAAKKASLRKTTLESNLSRSRQRLMGTYGNDMVSRENVVKGEVRRLPNGQLQYLETDKATGKEVWRNADYHHNWRAELM